jgi:hypothetical protein
LNTVSAEQVVADPAAAVRAALAALRDRRSLAVHFDVDLVDFGQVPLSEHTGANQGIAFEPALAALGELLLDPRVRIVTIIEHNPCTAHPTGPTPGDSPTRSPAPALLSDPADVLLTTPAVPRRRRSADARSRCSQGPLADARNATGCDCEVAVAQGAGQLDADCSLREQPETRDAHLAYLLGWPRAAR